jgi:hypothetical protein
MPDFRQTDDDTQRLRDVFTKARLIVDRRSNTYGDAWRASGALGAIAKARSKLDRVEAVLRNGEVSNGALDAAIDDLLDGINYQAFAYLSIREGNIEGQTEQARCSWSRCGATAHLPSLTNCLLQAGHNHSHAARHEHDKKIVEF